MKVYVVEHASASTQDIEGIFDSEAVAREYVKTSLTWAIEDRRYFDCEERRKLYPDMVASYRSGYDEHGNGGNENVAITAYELRSQAGE